MGSVPESELRKYNEKLKSEGRPEVIVKNYQNYPELLLDLKNERLDAIFGADAVINACIKDEAKSNLYEIIGTFGSARYISLVTRKEDEDLRNFLNEEILKMKKSGKLAELQKKWFGTVWDLPDTLS